MAKIHDSQPASYAQRQAPSGVAHPRTRPSRSDAWLSVPPLKLTPAVQIFLPTSSPELLANARLQLPSLALRAPETLSSSHLSHLLQVLAVDDLLSVRDDNMPSVSTPAAAAADSDSHKWMRS
jgi:hypothetical protein